MNAFTNAAQKLGPLPRIEMERFAGRCWERRCNSSFLLLQFGGIFVPEIEKLSLPSRKSAKSFLAP
jgi:hypothetical protein